MKRLILGAIVVYLVTLIGCSAVQRAGMTDDMGAFVGATPYPNGTLHKDEKGNPIFDGQPDYKPGDVLLKAGEKAVDKVATGSWTELAGWGVSGLFALLVGIWKRRAIGQAIAGKIIDPTSKQP